VKKIEQASAGPALIRRKEASNLTFGWSLILPRALDEDEDDAMSFVNHLLTGTMHSRIYGAARKKGLAYGVFSDLTVGTYDSSWDFGGQVNLDTADGLFDIIVRELRAVREGKISESEIESAKSYALGRHQMGAQTVAQISNFYSERYFADDYVRNYEKIPEQIKRIKLNRMISMAGEFLDHDTWVLAGVSCGEKEDLVRLNDKLTELFSGSN
jgi:predicted Zn-dependent peptidase